MINTALMGTLLYVQWNLTGENIQLLENATVKQDVAMKSKSLPVTILDQLIRTMHKIRPHLMFILIFAAGIFARLWDFRGLPPGLNPDEASIGVEAYYLFKYGIDRNGISFPVHLISWGSGQNALYAYMILPLVALKGLNATSIRLPMLFSGILSIPLIYFAGKKLLEKNFGLIAMFFMAISPWHIVNSRWAVESNILPFFLLTGFTLLLFSNQKNHWFIFACISFALSLYAYGTAYVGVPIFMALTVPVLIYTKQITIKQAVTGLVVFSALALPIALFVIINTFQFNTIHLGIITIPRMPVQPRYEAMAAVFGNFPLQTMSENIGIMLKMLWSQEDAYPWNYVKPFGYFYKITFPFAFIGLLLAIPLGSNFEKKVERWLLLAWMIASIAIGIVHPTNLTRLNFIFTPILFFIAIFIFELDKRVKYSLAVTVLALSIGFVLFTQAYHGEEYRKRAGSVFNSGIIPAIEYATDNGKSSICFTESIYSSYIYVLLTQKTHPSEYVNDIEWLYPSDPNDPARTPREIGRYHFRLSDCSEDLDAVYILLLKESPPNKDIEYKSRKFDKFEVYSPKK
jgi:4-amino-4-deoxy-L-arabinose transferase-like glycosyltransferase